MLMFISKQVSVLDVDICGPSIPRIMGLEGEQVLHCRLHFDYIKLIKQADVLSNICF